MTHRIRKATVNDSALILEFIKELASYEELEHQVSGTVENIEHTLFSDHPKVEALILEVDNNPGGFSLFFHNYSTFLCKHGIYIEDIYVREKYRGKGYGKYLLQSICSIAKDRDCGRVEWWCLDWNKPSIDFYLKLGAEAMSEWTVYRLNRQKIEEIASE